MSVRKLITIVGLVAVGTWSTAQAQGATGGAAGGNAEMGRGAGGGAEAGAGGTGSAEAGAQGGHAGATARSEQGQAGLKSVSGTVESMKGNTLALKNRLNQTHEFTLSSETKYMKDGKKISRDQIKEGERVRAAFREEGGKLHATEIKVEKASEQGGSSSGSSMKQGKSESQGGSGSSSQSGSSGSQSQESQGSGSSSQGSSGGSGSSSQGSSSQEGSSSQGGGSNK